MLFHQVRHSAGESIPTWLGLGEREMKRTIWVAYTQTRQFILIVQIALASQPPEQRGTTWLRPFCICQEHRANGRDAGAGGDEQQCPCRIVPQIEIASRPGKGRRISFVQAKKVG